MKPAASFSIITGAASENFSAFSGNRSHFFPSAARKSLKMVRHNRPSPLHGRLLTAAALAGVLLSVIGCRGSKPPDSDAANPPAGESDSAEPSSSFDPGGDAADSVEGIAFHNVTRTTGVDFTYRNDEEADYFSILESMGGGVALWDFDRDGRGDLFFPGGGEFAKPDVIGRTSALYRQASSWQFDDVTTAGRTGRSPHYSHGTTVGDYDNDGFPDLLVTGYGGLLLFRNQGDGTFIEVATESGLTDELWSTSAAWGDLNNDGIDDLYVAHYVDWSWDNNPVCPGSGPQDRDVCPPRKFDGLPDAVYFGDGAGSFTEESERAELGDAGKGIGVILGDIELDGDLDIYVSNDTVPNFLYRNFGDGSFEEIGLTSATALGDRGTADGSMGTDLGDFDLDGLPDLWVANYQHETFALYRNLGDNMFRHVSRLRGVAAVGGQYVGWGTFFFDADLDGDEDLFAANGHVVRFPVESTLAQQPLLLENRGGERLVNVASSAGEYMASPHRGRGAAMGDVDRDGDIDLVVSHLNEPVALLRNETDVDHDWIAVRLIGAHSPRTAVGAVVTVELADGRRLVKQRTGGGSYASASAPEIHLGLGPAATIQRITVDWPSGRRDEFDEISVRQRLALIEAGRAVSLLPNTTPPVR